MSTVMDTKFSEEALQGIISFLQKQAEQRRSNTGGGQSMGKAAIDAFKQSYKQGGLESVDALINSINEELKKRQLREGLREGCALEESAAGIYLHITFADLSTDKVLARETILLKAREAAPAPD